MKKITFLLVLLVLTTLTNVALAQKGKTGSDIPVTSTIHDADADNRDVTGLPTPYRIQSDTLGTYKNQIDSVESIIQGIGDWELNTKTSAVRKVFIDFRDPVSADLSNQTPNPPFQSEKVPLRFISKCTQQTVKMQDMTLNNSYLCPLAISLDYGGATYAVRMNPSNFSGTDWAQWTCLSLNSSGKCSNWQMVPSSFHDGTRKARGQLLKISTVKGKTVEEKRGVFYLSFKIDATNP